MHSAKGTSWEKKNHLYIRKYRNDRGKWVYVYNSKDLGLNTNVVPDQNVEFTEEELDEALNKELKNNANQGRAENDTTGHRISTNGISNDRVYNYVGNALKRAKKDIVIDKKRSRGLNPSTR